MRRLRAPVRVAILYDRTEDTAFESAALAGEETTELVPVHVLLGEALAARGYSVSKIAATGDLTALTAELARDDSDVTFNICDGVEGDTKLGTRVAAILELLGKRFTGSGLAPMLLAEDKIVAKEIFRAHGISTPRYARVPLGTREWTERGLRFPLIVKPVDEDASVGITEKSVVHEVASLLEQVDAVHALGSDALVEEFIEGREVYAAVLGNAPPRVLPLVEWPLRSRHGIGSFAAKWETRHADYQRRADVLPRDLPRETVRTIERQALAAFSALKLSDYARFDVRLAPDGTAFFLEANPNPYLDATAELAMAAQAAGLDYGDLAERVIACALARGLPGEKRGPARATVRARAGRPRTPRRVRRPA